MYLFMAQSLYLNIGTQYLNIYRLNIGRSAYLVPLSDLALPTKEVPKVFDPQ